ncbi:MAG: hypothetical protein WCJ51_00845 [Candidatus Moraniibacteriota bacterium]
MKEAMGMPSSEKPLSGNEVLERYKESPDFKLKLVAVIAQGFKEDEISPKEDESSDAYYKRIGRFADKIDSDMENMQKNSDEWKVAKTNLCALLNLTAVTPNLYNPNLPAFDPGWTPYNTK